MSHVTEGNSETRRVNIPRHRREPGNPEIRTCNPTLTTELIIYVVHYFEDVHRLQCFLSCADDDV
jgi:hypothetical protein